MSLFFALLPLLSASAAEPTPPQSTEAPLRSHEELLEDAKNAYFSGQHAQAIRQLVALKTMVSSKLEPNIYGQAMVYLGEVQFMMQEQGRSWDTFRELLSHQPGYTLNPYFHPAEVITWFETVKLDSASKAPLTQATPNKRRSRFEWAPFGVGYLSQERYGRAVLSGALQAGLAFGSLRVAQNLRDLDKRVVPNGESGARPNNRDAIAPSFQALRNRRQWPLTAAFYLCWSLSVIDVRRDSRAVKPSLGVDLTPGQTSLYYRGHF